MNKTMARHPYAGREIALLTQHGKETVIAPVLDTTLGCQVRRVTGFDTDQLGTFTRDIPRIGTQLEAARRKARIGMEITGLPLGLASEGAFGPDPMLGVLPWNTELVLFIDDQLDIEIAGLAQQATRFAHLLTGDWETVHHFAIAEGFPTYHLAIRPAHQDDPRIEKGLGDWTELKAAFLRAIDRAGNGLVFIEHDVRAHVHPARRETIRLATENLRDKLLSCCPACGSVGFWPVEHITGLLCADCGAPTRDFCAEVWGCPHCAHRSKRTITGHADPGHCDRCNP
jgi:hypothetical protein